MSLMWISYIKSKTKKRHIRRRREICKYVRKKTVCKSNIDLNTDIVKARVCSSLLLQIVTSETKKIYNKNLCIIQSINILIKHLQIDL